MYFISLQKDEIHILNFVEASQFLNNVVCEGVMQFGME